MSRILIVEDEKAIADMLKNELQQSGYKTLSVHDGSQVIETVNILNPDLILLDILLPGLDGLTLCKKIRSTSEIPIIILTAKVEIEDRLQGLELGADDYICKPFSPREVVARVNCVLRRLKKHSLQNDVKLQLEKAGRKLVIDQETIELTAVEYRLLERLYNSPGKVFSREELMTLIYSDSRVVSDRTIDSHIRKLRKKIDDTKPGVDIIQSIYGSGYKFAYSQ